MIESSIYFSNFNIFLVMFQTSELFWWAVPYYFFDKAVLLHRNKEKCSQLCDRCLCVVVLYQCFAY